MSGALDKILNTLSLSDKAPKAELLAWGIALGIGPFLMHKDPVDQKKSVPRHQQFTNKAVYSDHAKGIFLRAEVQWPAPQPASPSKGGGSRGNAPTVFLLNIPIGNFSLHSTKPNPEQRTLSLNDAWMQADQLQADSVVKDAVPFLQVGHDSAVTFLQFKHVGKSLL